MTSFSGGTSGATALKLGLAEAAPASRAKPAEAAPAKSESGAGFKPAGTNAKAEGPSKAERSAAARVAGYQGDSCPECGNFTLVRNGTCLKCDTCGSTTGCS